MKNIFIIVISGLASAIVFWSLWGHNLCMYFNAGGELQLEKELSMQGKIIVSTLIGIASSIIVAVYFGVKYTVHRFRKNVNSVSVRETIEY